MFARLRRGWRLTKASFSVLSKDKEILWLPVLAFLSIVAGLAFWAGVGLATIGLPGGSATGPAHYVLAFCMYATATFGGTFFLAATIEMAAIRLEGEDPVLPDGLSKAWEKKGQLFAWALVAATVGMILRVIRRRARGLGRILGALVELGWAVATFFVVPLLVHKDLGPIEAVRESSSVMRHNWGETATGVVSTSVIFFVLGLVGLIPLFLGIAGGNAVTIAVGVGVALVYWLVLAAANSAVDGILKAALYRFAETGQVPAGFEAADPQTLRGQA